MHCKTPHSDYKRPWPQDKTPLENAGKASFKYNKASCSSNNASSTLGLRSNRRKPRRKYSLPFRFDDGGGFLPHHHKKVPCTKMLQSHNPPTFRRFVACPADDGPSTLARLSLPSAAYSDWRSIRYAFSDLDSTAIRLSGSNTTPAYRSSESSANAGMTLCDRTNYVPVRA